MPSAKKQEREVDLKDVLHNIEYVKTCIIAKRCTSCDEQTREWMLNIFKMLSEAATSLEKILIENDTLNK